MLSPKEFVAGWGKRDVPLMRFPKIAVEQLSLSEEDKTFLVQAGLPEDAAPFLTFEVPESGPSAGWSIFINSCLNALRAAGDVLPSK